MRSSSPVSPARRTRRLAERRARRRPALLAGGLAIAALTTVGITGAATTSAPSASDAFGTFALASATSAAPTATPTLAAPDAEADGVDTTIAAAESAISAAASVTADIQASGLDVGTPDVTIDTAALQAATDRLAALDGGLAAFAPAAADDLAALTAPVAERAVALRGSLEGAQQRKAEEEAAEKARQEAEAAAAAAAAAARPAASSRPSAPIPTGGGSGDNSPAGAQASAHAMLPEFGWGDDQFGCLVALWNKESGWNYQAHNSSSGAHGIPQALPGSKMASAGADWATNAATQVRWGLGYISGRYGSPCGAWDHSQSVGWY